jgi:hypothetical protein
MTDTITDEQEKAIVAMCLREEKLALGNVDGFRSGRSLSSETRRVRFNIVGTILLIFNQTTVI